MTRGKKSEKELTLEERLKQALVPAEEQPYSVPENWCWVYLKTLAQTSKEKTEDFSESKIKYVGLEHLQKDCGIVGYGSAADVKSLKNVFHSGQILYGKLRPYLNKHDVAEFSGVCSTDILVFNATSLVIPQYVNFFFDQQNFIEYASANSKGINLPRVSEAVILDAFSPLPPLAEQQRIVDRIESLFAKLDEAKEKAQIVVDGFEARKAAILHKAFTGELTEKWRQENNTALSSWENVPFDECILKMQNGLAKRNGTSGSLFVVLRLANLSDDGFNTEDLREILLDEKEQLNYALRQNDVIMIRVNGSKDNVGKQFLITTQKNWAFCDHIIRIVYKETIQPKYMIYFSKSEKYRFYVKENMVSSAGQNTISRKGMSKLIVPLPTLPEQEEIVSILDNLLNKEQQAKETAEAVLDQIEAMKKSILARAFRGELGTNDPAEESAEALLKQAL